MTEVTHGLITVRLNDAAILNHGEWYPDLEEFQLSEMPPSRENKWALSGLTYPLKIQLETGKSHRFRVYTVPTAIKGGLRFKVWHDPAPQQESPLKDRMSPSVQRLADLLQTNKTDTLKYMTEVFSMAGKGGVRLGEITEAVRSYMDDKVGQPTSKQAMERIRQKKQAKREEGLPRRQQNAEPSEATPSASPEQPAGRIKRERKHVSVWEIRK